MVPRFPFGHPFGPDGRGLDGGVWDWMPALMGIVIGLAVLCAVALWVIRSIGLMRMAKKLGLPDPWLAWIPGAAEYLFVKLAGGRQRKLGIAYMFVLFFGVIAGLLTLALGCVPAMMSGAWSGMYGGMRGMWGMMGGAYLGMMPGFILLSLSLVGAMVLRLILMYHVFRRFKPDNAVLFLVLSILFDFLGPVFILVSSFGTPDEKEAPAAPIPTSPEPPSCTPRAGS